MKLMSRKWATVVVVVIIAGIAIVSTIMIWLSFNEDPGLSEVGLEERFWIEDVHFYAIIQVNTDSSFITEGQSLHCSIEVHASSHDPVINVSRLDLGILIEQAYYKIEGDPGLFDLPGEFFLPQTSNGTWTYDLLLRFQTSGTHYIHFRTFAEDVSYSGSGVSTQGIPVQPWYVEQQAQASTLGLIGVVVSTAVALIGTIVLNTLDRLAEKEPLRED